MLSTEDWEIGAGRGGFTTCTSSRRRHPPPAWQHEGWDGETRLQLAAHVAVVGVEEHLALAHDLAAAVTLQHAAARLANAALGNGVGRVAGGVVTRRTIRRGRDVEAIDLHLVTVAGHVQ